MSAEDSHGLRLDPRLDVRALTPVFRRHGRLHLPGLLMGDEASALHMHLRGLKGWRRSLHTGGGQDLDIPVDQLEELPPAERAQLEQASHADAGDRLRYLFDTIRITDELVKGREVDPVLEDVHRFLNSPAVLDFIRRLTGDDRCTFIDGMATRYLPGHFLTAHHDEAEGEHRLYAYVLNLTERWRADWGGLLLFLDEDDHVEEGYVPAFNALNIFRVPARHAVSMVAPFAKTPRLSITGWIRSQPLPWDTRKGD